MMSKAANTREPATPWSVPVTLQDVPEEGLHVELKADEATRAAVAKSAGLRALPRLAATFEVKRRPGNGLHVVGRVSATVGQDCVVTLDPVENDVDEEVDLVFMPGAPGGAETVDVADDAPEPLVDETIDLGAIATEFLILGIDPYPRKPEAVFEAPKVENEASSHPFAALAALQKKPGQP
jgi:uncharacterized metal-binding protein YceD (DUF177 family)